LFEQPPHCEQLRLSLTTGRFVHNRWTLSQRSPRATANNIQNHDFIYFFTSPRTGLSNSVPYWSKSHNGPVQLQLNTPTFHTHSYPPPIWQTAGISCGCAETARQRACPTPTLIPPANYHASRGKLVGWARFPLGLCYHSNAC